MKTKLILSAVLLSAINSPATPVTVRFDDIDRPPADSYNIGGVDSLVQYGQVSTKAGVGLGAGPDSLISFTVWYEPSTGLVIDQGRQYAVWNAPGPIISISLTPYTLPILPAELRDEWDTHVSATVHYFPTTEGSATCHLHDENYYTTSSYPGEDYVPLDVQTFSWGFSVQSLTYEAASVPEPSTWALLIGGIGALMMWRRK